ncbi:MAG: dTDP-glucose 4,6-dehydratase [Anaerolineaceae bacterium]|nr:dTDP-glucose 4,6-dehydratase [Anaerolineaceae bacterium]
MNKKPLKNILVTGGAGFIGSNFIHYLLKTNENCQVVNLDSLTYAGYLENLRSVQNNPNYTFLKQDICDFDALKAVFIDYKIDTVVHFAAESHVDRSIANPGQFIQTNIVGTYNLLEIARSVWSENGGFDGKHFHHVSTDEVYGMLMMGDPAFTETTPYSPNSPYAASKASSDHIVRAYYHTFNLPVTITNCSNNYGPNQYPEKLIPLIILNAVSGKPLPIYGDGLQIRDWLYVEDHCEAILKVIKEGTLGETYNVGGGNQFPNIKIVKQICAFLDKELPTSPFVPHENLITFVKDRPGHDFRYDINFEKIKHELNWQPKFNLNEGLISTVKWYLSNRDWIESVTGKPIFQEWINNNYSDRKVAK